MNIRDTPQWRFQAQLSGLLRDRGAIVVPLYDIMPDGHDKAPLAQGQFKGYRAPDFLVTKSNRPALLEAKLKSSATYTHSEDRYDQGFGLRCWRDYCEIERLFGMPVWIAIGECDTHLVRMASLRSLGQPRIYSGDKMDAGGMVFWPQEKFIPWAGFNPENDVFPILPFDQTRDGHFT